MEENKIVTENGQEQELATEATDKKETVTEEVASEICEEVGDSDANKEKEEKASRSDKKRLKKAEAEIGELKKALESKNADCAELNDKYMRVCAEYDNFRKRSAKERDGIYSDASFDVLSQILPILDNLERAAQYNVEEMAQTPMGKGLELTLKSFSETLEKLGVKEIEALGNHFDPNLHNAVMHVEDESAGENEIVEVFMKGYAKGDKVLRYSMVKVAN